MKLNHFGKLKKEGGKLVYMKSSESIQYNQFKTDLEEGAVVELYMEQVHDTGTLAQLAKAHALIRELSNHTGISFEDLKTLIKEKAGLCLSRTVSGKEYFLCKSLGDASVEELSAFIQACIELGEEVNHPVQ